MLTPLEYSQLLVRICKERGIEPDRYLSGGSVQEFETTFAKMLGKESATFRADRNVGQPPGAAGPVRRKEPSNSSRAKVTFTVIPWIASRCSAI